MLLVAPYLVNHFSPTEYGAWSLYEVSIQVVNLVMLGGLDVGLMREYWLAPDDAKRAGLGGTVLLSIAVWGGALFACGLVISVAGVGSSLYERASLWLISLATAWAEAILALLLTLYRIRERATAFVALALCRMFLFLGGAMALVHAKRGVLGALSARLGATILVAGAAFAFGHVLVRFDPDWSGLKRILRYGLPLLPANFALYILFASDRYVLTHFATLEVVAVYTFAYKVASTLDVLVTRPFAIDWAPRRFKIATYSDARVRYGHVLLAYSWAGIAFALLVVAVAPALYSWLAPPVYGIGIRTVPVIVLAYLVYGLSYPLNVGIMLKGRTGYLPAVGWIAAAACLLLNWWWIPRFGMLGAAWATVVAYGVWTLGVAWGSQRVYPLSYPWRQLGAVLGIGVASYLGLQLLDMAVGPNQPLLGVALRVSWVLLGAAASGVLMYRRISPTKETFTRVRVR